MVCVCKCLFAGVLVYAWWPFHLRRNPLVFLGLIPGRLLMVYATDVLMEFSDPKMNARS